MPVTQSDSQTNSVSASASPSSIARWLSVFLLVSLSLFLVACQSEFNPFGEAETTPSPASEAETATPRPRSTAADSIPSNPQPSVIELRVWSVESFSPQVDLIGEQLNTFQQENPNIQVDFILKRASGQAGMLNYLTSAQAVAPNIMPDVIILNSREVMQAWNNNLIQSLNGKIDRTLIEDIFPSALSLTSSNEQLAGLPLEVSFEHLIYNSSVITDPPISWDNVLSQTYRYDFPARGVNGLLNDTVLGHYLSTSPQLSDEQGRPVIDEPALRFLLTTYEQAVENGQLSASMLEVSTPDELIEQFLSVETEMTHITAHRYLNDRRLLNDNAFAAVPSLNGETVVIGEGLTIALITSDPTRQPQAITLMETLLESNFNAALAARNTAVPSRRSAFESIDGTDPYWRFLRGNLDSLTPPPNFSGYDQLSRILQQAVVQVISGEATAEDAVQTAITALNQR